MDMAVTMDLRGLNHMGSEMRWVHARLERWGQYARTHELRAWPRQTLLARVIECGPDGATIRGTGGSDIPGDIARVDAAVAHLGDIDGKVIRAYYLEWAPPEVMARKVRMELRRFRSALQRARWRVHAYLAAITEVDDSIK